jgi:ParB-like chromosome segregation protein Spo0J
MMDEDELNKLAADIRANGLRKPVHLHVDPETHKQTLLDGRNRLEALARAGIDLDNPLIFETTDVADPASLVTSLNIHRRHLTKSQQATLIRKVAEAQHENDPAKLARSYSPNAGRRGGSTKDPVLEKAKKIGRDHGISARTIERASAENQSRPTGRRKRASARPKPQAASPDPSVEPVAALATSEVPPPAERRDPASEHEPLVLRDLGLAFLEDVKRLVSLGDGSGHIVGVIESLRDMTCEVKAALDSLLASLQERQSC